MPLMSIASTPIAESPAERRGTTIDRPIRIFADRLWRPIRPWLPARLRIRTEWQWSVDNIPAQQSTRYSEIRVETHIGIEQVIAGVVGQIEV